MNENTANRLDLGVAHDPELAEALAQLGWYDVHTRDHDHDQLTTALRAAAEAGQPFPVFVSAAPGSDWAHTAAQAAAHTPAVVVITPPAGPDQAPPAGCRTVAGPVRLADLLGTFGQQPPVPEHISGPIFGPTSTTPPRPVTAGGWGQLDLSPQPVQTMANENIIAPAASTVGHPTQSPRTPPRAPATTQQRLPAAPAAQPWQPGAHVAAFDAMSHVHRDLGQRRNQRTILVWSGRGGPGKSTFSASLAATAASMDIRTCLVDANVGQSDQRLFLGISKNSPLRTMWDAALSGDPAEAIVGPDELANLRPGAQLPARYSLVAAPPPQHAADPRINPTLARRILAAAQASHDLVVVDTQMIESSRAEMVDGFVVPTLLEGAWGLGLSDGSVQGVEHLIENLHRFARLQVPRDKMMVAFNKVPADTNIQIEAVNQHLHQMAHVLGVAWADEKLISQSNAGEPIIGARSIAHVVETALHRVLGTPVVTEPWQPGRHTPITALRGRKGLFRRRNGGGR